MSSSRAGGDTRPDVAPRPTSVRTVVAAFDDTIDAEHVLAALRRREHPSEAISVILRERAANMVDINGPRPVLARVIASSALDAASGWLKGIASLILPDRASYLVAGPIGVVLANLKGTAHHGTPLDREDVTIDLTTRQLMRALSTFGLDPREAFYLERRVVAGSPLIGVTSSDPQVLRSAHQIFSRFNAVYLGLAQTDEGVRAHADRLLRMGPQASGDVLIADAISPLRRFYQLAADQLPAGHVGILGRTAVTEQGAEIGTLADVLYQPGAEVNPGAATPRYAVIVFGGVLGLGRHHVAIPAEVVELDANPVRVAIDQNELQAAPRFSFDAPMSRLDEVEIRDYFNVRPYWNEVSADVGKF
jgi:hypothetical protein